MSECDGVEAIKMITADKKKAEPLLKKRNNQWAHEVLKELTVSPGRVIPLSYGDRFIPRRFAVKEKDTNENFLFKREKQDFLATPFSPSQWRYKGLKMMINNSFGIKQRRILEFSDLASKSNVLRSSNVLPAVPTYEFIYGTLDGLDWPCTPRVKPMACADTTHDLPYFDMFSDINLIDWSVNGEIAASFGRDLVLWKPALDMTLVYRIRNCKAIAYCPKGKFLAISSKTFEWPVFELWDHQRYKELCIYSGYVFDNNACMVLCIEWASSGKYVVGGTSEGSVYVFTSPDLAVYKVLKNHKQPVFMVKFSPTMRYLATSDVEGNIYVYNWPSCDIHVVLRSKRKLRVVIDWHPWNGTDLAISEHSPASIVILHVPSREIVAYYQRKDQKVEIDFITFNKLTGELLVSYSDKDSDGCLRSEIMVMSSLDRVVDLLRVPNSCVRFMMWSPSGLELATAGNDETLTIWNFLPNPSNVTHSARVPLKKPAKTTSHSAFGKEFCKWTHIR